MANLNFEVTIGYMGEDFSLELSSSLYTESDILEAAQALFKEHLEQQGIELNEESELSEEFSIDDWQECPEFLQDLETLAEYFEAGEDYDIEVYEAASELDIPFSDVSEAYQGQFNSDEDFAQDMAEQLGSIDKNASWPMNCIDWEYAAKELMYDYSESNGHYFRNL